MNTMNINFFKMHGSGNDFVMFDCLKEPVMPEDLNYLSLKVCDRRYGVGADTMVMICKSDVADVRIRYFNTDGTEAELCGMATRCVTHYLITHRIFGDQTEFVYETLAGPLYAKGIFENGELVGTLIDMGIPRYMPLTSIDGEKLGIEGGRLTAGDREFDYIPVSMGNPHCVIYCKDVDNLDVQKYGAIIEKHPNFPEGTNVEFVQVLDDHNVKCRIWERGGMETTACGSGSCAICVAGFLTGRTQRQNSVHYPGGIIKDFWDPEDNHIYMTTEIAEEVFTGTFFLK